MSLFLYSFEVKDDPAKGGEEEDPSCRYVDSKLSSRRR